MTGYYRPPRIVKAELQEREDKNMTTITYFHLTHKAGRDHNEDAVLSLSRDSHYLFVVADGMGGVGGGEVASSIAIKTMEEAFTCVDPASARHERILRDAIIQANQTIVKKAQENLNNKGMGTTVTSLLTDGRRAIVANIGDSRIYVFRKWVLHQITKDHTLLQEWLEIGKLTKEELWKHPKRNVITRSLGMDYGIETAIDIYRLDVEADDIFLLCSDGLTDYVPEEKIRHILSSFSFEVPEKLCQRLFQEALEGNTGDNVSVIIVKV